MIKPQQTFYVFPDNGKVFFHVKVWRTKADFHRFLRRSRGYSKKNAETIIALCVEMGTYNSKTLAVGCCIGELNFYHYRFRMGIVAHECAHATLRYFDFRRRYDQSTGRNGVGEEAFCWVLGNLVSDIVWKHNHYRSRRVCSLPYWNHCPFPKAKVGMKKRRYAKRDRLLIDGIR